MTIVTLRGTGEFVLPGEVLELDADDEGVVSLRNRRGKERTHRAAEAQGIEDEAGWGAAPPGGEPYVGDGVTTTITRPMI